MDKELQTASYVRITNQRMQAYVYLVPPMESTSYSKDSILRFLNEQGVVSGILEENIDKILCNNCYNKEIEIAKGLHPIDGCDGEYIFEFSKNMDRKDKRNIDGSLNYWGISLIQHVDRNQVIARYHPPTKGLNGYQVDGNILFAKDGRDLSPLRGKGLVRTQEGLTYRAITDGKIEFKNDRIYITNLYENHGSLDLWMGDIDFRGDVIVHGEVRSGVTITATGSITIDGKVYCAQLIAGKDIILRSGMKGGRDAYVKAHGNIYVESLENTKVEAKGSIFTNRIIESRIFAGNQIIITAENGSIIGGHVIGVNGLETGILGDREHTVTKVSTGNGKKRYERIEYLEGFIVETEEELKRVERSIRKLEEENGKRPVPVVNDPRQMLCLRTKLKNIRLLAESRDELESLRKAVEESKEPYISVKKAAYPGTVIGIEGKEVEINEILGSVEIRKNDNNIVIMPKSTE